LGLIKNAVTEGMLVIEKIRQVHQPVDGIADLIIVGAGPAGLSAALAAKEAGLTSMVFEQGSFANTIRRFPNRKIVMAEPVRIPLYGSLWISDAPKETLLGVWKTIIESSGIQIHENEQVVDVKRGADDVFRVATVRGTYACARVILAIGKRGTPNELKVAGADLPKVFYRLTDAAEYTGSEILVVGGGDSACEAAIGLGKQPGNRVILSYRGERIARAGERNRAALSNYAAQGLVQVELGTQVEEIRDREVTLRCAGGELRRFGNDYVFAFLGGTSPKEFLEKMGVSMVTKEVRMEAAEREALVS
jgi:thioredoxin reductase